MDERDRIAAEIEAVAIEEGRKSAPGGFNAWLPIADWHLARVREARAKAFEEAAEIVNRIYDVKMGGLAVTTAFNQIRALAAREREVKP